MIKNRTIIIFCFLWLLMAWFIVSYDVVLIIKLYPWLTWLPIFLLMFIYGKDVKKYLLCNYISLYEEVFKIRPLVDNFAFLKFVFLASDSQDLQKVKDTGKIIYLVDFILLISIALVRILG